MDTLAPWAEPVLMTADQLLRLPEDGWCYELVDGRLVRMSPTGSEHGEVVMALLAAVHRYASERQLGIVLPPEAGFWLSPPGSPDTVLAPDLAFIGTERVAVARVKGYPRLAPDLVAEVVSPSQTHRKMAAKAQRWLQAGVRVVWILFPRTQTVEVWRDGERIGTLSAEDDLSGEGVLPGFVCPVRQLFPGPFEQR